MNKLCRFNYLYRCSLNRIILINRHNGVPICDSVNKCCYPRFFFSGLNENSVKSDQQLEQQGLRLTFNIVNMLHTWTERRCLLKLKGSTLVHIQTRGIKKSKHYRKRPSRDDESDESESDTDESDSDTDDSDDLSDDDDSENVFAVDNDAPSVYSEMVINTMRADRVAIKGLKLTNSEFIDTFYASKVLKNGKLLIKKGQKLRTNDKVDVVINQTPGKLKVKRVKILAVIDDRSMSTGTVRIRVWRLPFEIPAPPGWKI